MATSATRTAAVASRRLARRLLSTVSAPLLLGHFHHPTPVPPKDTPPARMLPSAAAAFQPLTAASPRLSLDFVPDLSDFNLYDSHLGLLLLRRRDSLSTSPRLFLVCDPVSRRHVLLHPPPIDRFSGGKVFGAAILSRDADDPDGGLRFEDVCVAVDVDRPRAWVASFRDGACTWRAQPRPRDVVIDFDPYWLEYVCVRAAGSLYWHICNNPCALALDAATLAFSFLRAPTLMWGTDTPYGHEYRVGEMPEDGRLCVGSLENDWLQLCVRGKGNKSSSHGWVLERRVRLKEALDAVPWLPKNPPHRVASLWLSDVDGGRTGRVFIATMGYGRFSYHMESDKLEPLATEDGKDYGHPIFPYFSAPAGVASD